MCCYSGRVAIVTVSGCHLLLLQSQLHLMCIAKGVDKNTSHFGVYSMCNDSETCQIVIEY